MRPMTNRKRPQVYITRKLPDAVETRMRELFEAEPRGSIEAKHKGRLAMYFLTGIRPGLARDPEGRLPGEEFSTAATTPYSQTYPRISVEIPSLSHPMPSSQRPRYSLLGS